MKAKEFAIALDNQLKDYDVELWITENINSFNWEVCDSTSDFLFVGNIFEDKVPFSPELFVYNMRRLGYFITYHHSRLSHYTIRTGEIK